jgi:hypothetical protein
VDILKEESQSERDYVTKNMFRLDVDGNGSVSFTELVRLSSLREISCLNGTAEK